MKALFTVLMSLVLSAPAFADDGVKYICKGESSSGKTFVLTQLGYGAVQEGKKYAFLFEIYESTQRDPSMVSKVFAQSEDVYFQFGNKADKVSGHIYLDELYEASVTVSGVDYRMNCQ